MIDSSSIAKTNQIFDRFIFLQIQLSKYYLSASACSSMQSSIRDSRIDSKKESYLPPPIKLKIAVVGDPGSGKTSLIQCMRKKQFDPNTERTQSMEMSILEITTKFKTSFRYSSTKDQNYRYEIQLWDCGSNFGTYNDYTKKAFFKNVSVAFITFDLTDKKSLQRVPMWVHECQLHECYLIFVFGMKKDLLEGEADEYELDHFFDEYDLRHYLYSAKEYHELAIQKLFMKIDRESVYSRSSVAKGGRYSIPVSRMSKHVTDDDPDFSSDSYLDGHSR